MNPYREEKEELNFCTICGSKAVHWYIHQYSFARCSNHEIPFDLKKYWPEPQLRKVEKWEAETEMWVTPIIES